MINIYNFKNRQQENLQTKPTTEGNPSSGKMKVSIPKYEDPTKEFTAKELKWSFWYVQHKVWLYRIGLISLILLNLGFLGFSVWQWGAYVWGITDNQKLEQNLAASVNYMGIHPHFGAQQIQVLSTQVISGRTDKFDVVAELVNPNSRFLVMFDYYFVVGDKKTEVQKSFLLPGESRPVAVLGLADALGSPSIVMENIKYTRIPNQQVGDVAAWQAYRLNFQVSDFVFLKSLAQTGDNADAIQFKLTNTSPYSYVNVDFYVVLLQNSQMVGIVPLHVDEIDSLETKDIDLRNFVQNLNVSDIKIFPIINIYDNGVYAP